MVVVVVVVLDDAGGNGWGCIPQERIDVMQWC